MKLDALAFGAHPDDVELACGGTLAKLLNLGYATGMVSLTRGELGTRGTPEIRKSEFEAAAKILDLPVAKILDIPDGNVASTTVNRRKVIDEIRKYRPSLIFLPYFKDRHPDHINASNLVREACYQAGLIQIESEYPAFRPTQLLFCTSYESFAPSFVVDISETFERKMNAVYAYKSQFHIPDRTNADNDNQTFISKPAFMEAVITRNKYYGNLIGAAYGEPFWIRETIPIDDPVSHFQNRKS
ncbi:bacillithiol biosynthesis deacetylase BshB1 [candidate division KSB1 bacterium]|nr:bacillithiol biosynthesis deacetylase BshB1 [candidate division KSB1 bacterium]